jgi:septum formation protein
MKSGLENWPRVYLASASPRRRELLAQLGVHCTVVPAHIDETALAGETAADLVCRLATAKARAATAGITELLPVVAADTVVTLGDSIFGKPADLPAAQAMLQRLSARTHEVYTAVAVGSQGRERVELSRSEVTFRALDPAEIEAYWATGEPADKAGAYAIQGLGAMFISRLVGSYSGVMGLPLWETARLLQQAGVPLLRAARP